MTLSGSLAPLQHENFRWYWIAVTVNLAGTTMSAVALAFAVLAISDSPSALGVVLAAGTVPTVLFLLLGGVIADRWPLTAVLRVGMAVLALSQGAIAVLVITGVAEIWMLVVLSAVNGTALAVVFPAMQSITPRLVPRDLLQKAIALQSFSRGALRVVGPTISALLVVGVGAETASALTSFAWLALVAGVVGPLLLLAMIQRDGPTRGTSLLFLVPSVTAFLGWALLGQPVGAMASVGLGIAGLGLWMGRRTTSPGPAPQRVPVPVGVHPATDRQLCGCP